jgi:hypothetical protein
MSFHCLLHILLTFKAITMRYIIPITMLFFVLLSACSKDDDADKKDKKSNFSEPEEYIENPSVTAAINESGISINEGDNPPPLAGTYLADGEVVDASYSANSIIGLPINSEIKLYNQTASGKIDFQEKTSGITVWGSGGYITGDNGKFTIWQESRQSGSEAGLPNDITINVALLMSGTKLSSGDLTAKGISIITEVSTTNDEYDTEAIEGIWWMWDADFDLQTENNKSAIVEIEKQQISLTTQKVLQMIVEKNSISE